jgi:DNA-binding NarL/FixJ family response regulator
VSWRGVLAPPRRLVGSPLVTIRVVLAEDNALLREGVARLLERAEGIELVGTAIDRPELEQLIEAVDPQVVVTDIRMPPTGTDEGIQIAAQLRVDRPEVGVVVLSQYAEPAYALALLEGGSEGRAYLLKERVSDVDDLLAAIQEVAKGGSVIDSKVVEGLVSTKQPRSGAMERLSPREREILGEMAQGKSNAAIAASLVLSTRAVEKHTNSIFSKLDLTEEVDVNRRVKAVLLYLSDAGGGG